MRKIARRITAVRNGSLSHSGSMALLAFDALLVRGAIGTVVYRECGSD
jgi:hypothetical protein